jgi:uncharacterized protein
MNTTIANNTSGETDLQRLLAGLAPMLADRPRVIRSQSTDAPLPTDVIMLFREDEGITVIAPAAVPALEQNDDEPLWAQITLRIHSSLEAVGMMAAIAAALTADDIPCNAVSAYFHDHIFVPWARRDDALSALQQLATGSRA